MSEGKRRRYRKVKQDDKRPVILGLAKREESSASSSFNSHKYSDMDMQPKILLKTKFEKDIIEANSNSEAVTQIPLKTIIVTRSSESAPSPAFSPNTTREQTVSNADATQSAATQLIEPVPLMTRPAWIISSTGSINTSARKLLMKANTDFLVVGVIGTQGVGKSTICNLLANEDPNYDYYSKVFEEEDSIFPTKLKQHKCSARSRTESTHLFITPDRMLLIDSPPVLCNSYKKDMTTNELDDLRSIISFLSICHLIIVVQDDYVNMSFLRLLHFAELMKPTQDNKPFVSDYLPNILFVKNRAKRQDYVPGQKEMMDDMLKAFFKDSQLRVFVGQTAAEQQHRQKRGRGLPEAERIINSILIPDVKDTATTSFHKPLSDIIEELRTLVFMTPRNELYAGPTELTEAIWFELLNKVAADAQHFFFDTYEEIHRKHLEVGASSGVGKDTHDNWRE